MSILEKLTEGIVSRDLSKDGHAIVDKWEKTGLLEGLEDDTKRNNMAVLLENQAKELLREASTMAVGQDVEGFAAVAFPIVRRVFAGLIANDLVSVQPMSLPSGLIFFLDFTYGGTPGEDSRLDNLTGTSLFGGGKVAAGIVDGISLTGDDISTSFYNLNNGYSSPTGTNETQIATAVASGSIGGTTAADAEIEKLCRYDPDIPSGTAVAVASLSGTQLDQLSYDDLVSITRNPLTGRQARRLSALSGSSSTVVNVFSVQTGSETTDSLMESLTGAVATSYVQTDNFTGGAGDPGSVLATQRWGLENNPDIPEIDIKVDSVAVTASTKKLKAKWTPELGQDLNAYHNLDAEVELTSILSEQIALEIDQEILEDLVKGAKAGTYYWSRRPGKFLTRDTGARVTGSDVGDFTGNVSEWYETLLETVNDISAQIHRKTLRGGANFIVCGPEVSNILEFTSGFKARVTHDDDKGNAGAVNVGNISKKWDVYVDPYFPRNVLLIGRKGSSFLESGYVYAPYVPLQTTPTIFGIEDFVPRKGVMTRYAKKMVRPDMYGIVVVEDLLG